MKKLSLFILSSMAFLLLSCGSLKNIKSGQYVQLQPGDSWESLAKEFNVPETILKNENIENPFVVGKWVFIPKNIGLNSFLRFHGVGSTPREIYNGKLLWPVPSVTRISSFYGKRGKRFHDGIDIPAPRGTHILASEKGRVIYSGNKLKGYGNLLIISHSGGLVTVYAHCQKLFVKKGAWVHRGEVIAKVGSTGRSSGPHLHYEVRHRERPIDPMRYIAKSRKTFLAMKY